MTSDQAVSRVRAAFDSSIYRIAAEAAGFVFSPIQTIVPFEPGFPHCIQLAIDVRCVCGRVERFGMFVSVEAAAHPIWPEALDPVRRMDSSGAFGYDHLLADGYAEDVAAGIVAKYTAELRRLKNDRLRSRA